MRMRLICFKNDPDGGWWTRKIWFPFAPFPGMLVGFHTVEEVLVCQGDLDGEGEVEVRLNDAEPESAKILEDQGWQYETEV